MLTTSPITATSPLAAWLCYLQQQHPKAIELGLERVAQVAQRLALQRPAGLVFTVAGTNGKGTTCRMLEAILLAAGLSVAVYSSPHLLRYTERVRINGRELPESRHCQAFAAIEAQRGDTPLTYFEYGTLAALWLFKQAQPEVIILEVGLGGRLDATNIVDADVAVITSIALDHTDWLGNDRQSIGREKAGIFRSGKPAVVGEPDMPDAIAQVAQDTGALLLACGKDWHYQPLPARQTGGQAAGWHFTDIQGNTEDLPLPHIPLANAATALAAISASGLSISKAAILQGLRHAELSGRFQTVAQAPRIILDVAHNPHAAGWLAKRLAAESKSGRLLAVVGMLRDKDIAGTLGQLSALVDSWYCASLQGERAASAQQLAQYLPQATTYADVNQALQAAMKQAQSCDTVLVCGSFHTVGQAMQALNIGLAETDLSETLTETALTAIKAKNTAVTNCAQGATGGK